MSSLDQCVNLDDLRLLAKRRVPRAVFDYADGGAEDEVTRRRNSDAFSQYQLVPRVLRNVAEVDLRRRVLGTELDWPLILSPTAMGQLFHPDGELAVARAAADAGTVMTLSSIATTAVGQLAEAVKGPKWFQIYVWRDKGITTDLISECRELGYQAVMLTVDAPVAGHRERDTRNGMTVPPALTFSALVDAALHPRWWWNYLWRAKVSFANIEGRGTANLGGDLYDFMSYVNRQFDPSVTWDQAAEMIELWGGEFAIKGIMSPQDAEKAVSLGATGVVVSNHGGRQLDSAPAPLDVLPDIVSAVGGKADVLLDGGIRRGTDILKALALGATACMTGRPYLYGLCAAGEAGARKAIDMLKEQTERNMKLMCLQSLADLDSSCVRKLK